MATIVTRITGGTAKNAPLTNTEFDNNFINLNDNKAELVSPTITTPVIAQINDADGHAELKFTSIASAVNQVTIQNNSSGEPPHIKATGSDSNISLHLQAKGTGTVVIHSAIDTTKRVTFHPNGTTNTITTIQTSATANHTVTLPDATDTLVGKATTDTLTNKTLTSPTLTDPVLGTPASGNLTNCTFPTLNQNTSGTAAGLSTTLAVASGGTGTTALTAGNVVIGAGTSAVTFVAPGTSGNVLSSNGSTWTSVAAGGGVPAGAIMAFGSATPPTGWLACNGANVSRTTYSDLFAVISTTFGVGDGSTTFALPVSARRTMVGSGGTGTATLGNAVGNSGGEEKHTQTTAELAVHGHRFSGGSHGAGLGGSNYPTCVGFPGLAATPGYTNTFGSGVIGIEASGSGTAFNVMQPSLIVTYIIKT